jgi:lipid-A-disaccharide synthase
VFVSAGEPSGDAHAAEVVRRLRANQEGMTVDGIGGPRMEEAGARVVARMEDLSAIGVAEALRSVPTHVALLAQLKRRFALEQYDLAVLVDYPGFHLRLARVARRRGVPVLYYIAPQLWAWGSWRLPALRRGVSHLATILPFEQEFFADRGIPTTFVGHPLLDRPAAPTRDAARRTLGVSNDVPLLSLSPGSRRAEVRRLWPALRRAAHRLRAAVPELEVVLLEAPCGVTPADPAFRVWRGDPAVVFAAADAGLCKSGTTTLEAALAGMPMVIAYRMHPASFALAKRVVSVPSVGLVNLIAGQSVAPELLQGEATPEALASAALPLLDPAGREARTQRAALEAVRSALGSPGAAGRVAELARELAA